MEDPNDTAVLDRVSLMCGFVKPSLIKPANLVGQFANPWYIFEG